MKLRLLPLILPLVLSGLCFVQCRKPPAASVPGRVPHSPVSASLAASFSGDAAHAHVERIVSFGPRPPASEGYEKTLEYLEGTLREFGWETTRQSFRAATPDGPIDFTNLLARHSTAPAHPESLPVVIGGHIDSKTMSFPFVGANDGGSSTGILLELARVLSTDPAAASGVELVFFDGEEAFRPSITPTDGLYGSKYFAHSLASRSSWPSLGIVLDIVGDPNFPLYYNVEAPETFTSIVGRAADGIGFPKGVGKAPGPVIDDHVPLQNTGLPCLHLIGDFQQMNYWHQPGDTLDKVSAEMLGKVGRLTLMFLTETDGSVK